VLLIVFAAAVPVVLAGCSDSGGGDPIDNLAPNVWLSSAPPEGTTEKYTVHLYWGGWDPDGEIAYYEYAITDNETGTFDPADTTRVGDVNPWRKVVANDSVFTFSADILAEPNTTKMVSEFKRSHTFFVRAVDGHGMPSREPAYRSFTSRTLSPEVTIQVPRRSGLNPALVPAITTFRWVAQDYVDNLLTPQDPDSVQWALVSAGAGYTQTIDWLRTSPDAAAAWGPWVDYKAPEDKGRFWTTNPLDLGPYVFAIRAKDEAGAVTPVLDELYNVRRVRVSRRSSGPTLKVSNQYLGTVTTTICNSPLVILDLPAGVPMQFCWEASADTYGGLVSGYRYGWDIADLSDPEQWETDYTPFTTTRACSPPRTFFFGTHSFAVEVVDNSGICARTEIKINIIQFTLQKNLILFDDFFADKNSAAGWNGTGKGVLPNDAEHDAFWVDMLSQVEGFDPNVDVLEVFQGATVPLTTVADYKSVVWSVFSDKGSISNADLPKLYEFIQYRPKNPSTSVAGKREPNMMALFMAAGGHIFISGLQPMSSVVERNLAPGARYPLIYKYELEGVQGPTRPDLDRPIGDESFGYNEMCVDVVDYCVLDARTRRNEGTYCNVLTTRRLAGNVRRDDTMREAHPLDPAFPRLTFRIEAAGPNKAYNETVKGIDAEIYNPRYFAQLCEYVPTVTRDCFEPIYGLECLDKVEPIYRQPIAFWSSAFADRVAEVPGAVGARSVVFGFPPVYFNPDEVRPAIEHILFDEWQLPRKVQ
jgi:hypothetical protein